MAEHKLGTDLVHSPVEYLCGNPADKKYEAKEATDVYGLKGPEGVSANFVDPVLLYEDITPQKSTDAPSDAKLFKGQRSDG